MRYNITNRRKSMSANNNMLNFLKADLWDDWGKQGTDQRKGVKAPPSQKPYPKDAVLFDLVAPENMTVGQIPLINAIRQRRSRREYSQDPLSLEELSFLLWATQGVDQEATRNFREWLAGAVGIPINEIPTLMRTVPSGGACHPFESYLLVNRVDGLQAGIYRYLAMEHKLLYLHGNPELDEKTVGKLPSMFLRGAVVFLWTAIPYRTEWRYTLVAPKMIAQESGHICQNLYLACEAIGAGTCAVGAYSQKLMDDLLGVDGIEEFTIYVAPVGKIALTHG
jgi:SagB-type dehydrogenase family enzyme